MNAFEKRQAIRKAKSAEYYKNAKLKKSLRYYDAVKYYEAAFLELNGQLPLTVPKESPEKLLAYGRTMYARAHEISMETEDD